MRPHEKCAKMIRFCEIFENFRGMYKIHTQTNELNFTWTAWKKLKTSVIPLLFYFSFNIKPYTSIFEDVHRIILKRAIFLPDHESCDLVSRLSWLISDKRYNRADLTRSNGAWNVACTSGFMVVLLPDRSSRVQTGLTRSLQAPLESKNSKKNTSLTWIYQILRTKWQT